ncbi:MAG TPA: cellulase family glycosylhydrolase [Segeticoccus sp.]|nr:cellulase family glycosylhydrolase [Segeticoccus sp.]
MPDDLATDAPQRRDLAALRVNGRAASWVGANFWSRRGGPLMWRQDADDTWRAELLILRDHGLDTTRSFLYWPDAMPEPHRLDEAVLERYRRFLDLHDELGMRTVPTFLVGHMSGENWDPAWRHDRDLYTDTWLVARQAWYVRSVTRRFADHPAVAAWLLTNEMPIYGGHAPTAVVSAWAELMLQAVRAGGGHQPVSIGDGAWGVEVTGRDNGFSVRELAELSDFVGPHVYPMEDDVVRQHLKAAFTCELAAVGGRPVVLEEFGLTSDFASDEHAAHYYRQVLHLSLLAGATGWLAWNNTDYDDLAGQPPYSHHAFELHFGITDANGRPKPPLLELRRFRAVLDAVDITRCVRWPSDVALVVPSYLECTEPLTLHEQERGYVFRCLEQAHIAAREADLPPCLVRERDGIVSRADAATEGFRLYLLPSTKQLTAPGWRQLLDRAREGATVYTSYGSGEVDVQRGPWWSHTTELFGVRHQLAYGRVNPVRDEIVTWQLERDFGGLRKGERLAFPAAGGPNARTFLPVEVDGAEVVARDQHGRVALTCHAVGAGQAVLSTYPIEYFAAARPDGNPDDTWRLYDALAREAGVRRTMHVQNPGVLVDGLVRDDGRRFAWLVSETPEEQQVALPLPTGTRAVSVVNRQQDQAGSDMTGSKVTLPAYGVRVLELVGDQPDDDGPERAGQTRRPATSAADHRRE